MQVGPETCLSARLAIYRDGEPEPKVEEVQGTGPEELIHRLCTAMDLVIRDQGVILPQPAIKALIENLIHAGFLSATISVLDGGRTIRVADRGPGIPDKRLAVEPGYSSAGDAERRIIAGVGAGLAVAARLMEECGGRLEISDNLGGGTVVTLEFAGTGKDVSPAIARPQPTRLNRSPLSSDGPSELSDNGKRVLLLLAELGDSGLTTICDELRIPAVAARSEIDSLRRLGLLDPAGEQAHLVLTAAGLSYLDGIFVE